MNRRTGFLVSCLVAAGIASPALADVADDLQAIADDLAAESGVGALLRVEDAVQGSFALAAGFRETNTMTAAQPGDRFRIASNSKSFTAAATLLLRDEGRLSLDDTVADLLPAYDIPSNDVITVWNLLTHTSGLPDHNNDTNYFDEAFLANPATNFAPEEIFAVVNALPAHFAPGEAWSYCDTGYYVLHLIVAARNTNGWSFANFIRNRLVTPLGLTNTFVPDAGNDFLRQIPGDHLDGYLLFDEETADATNVTEVGQSWDIGCGGMVSSTEDLTKWIRSLHDGTVLGPASRIELATVTEQSRRAGSLYGMATMVSPLLGYGHSGITLGYVSWMFYDPVHQTAYADVINLESENLLFAPRTALVEAKQALGFTNDFFSFLPATATNLSLGGGQIAWLSMPVSSNSSYTLDLVSTSRVTVLVSDPQGTPVGKFLPAYGLTFTPTNGGDCLIAVFNDGPEPAQCRLASYTNGLPFYRTALPEEHPDFMANPWYDGSEFGYVYVPASRETDDVHSYRLPVVKLAAGPDATNGPLIYLSGGPGSSAINQPFMFAPFTNVCDVIIMNQRGTYLSQPDLFPLSDDETTAALQFRLGGPDGMDFNTINTRENAADVHDVATALGYSQFNVWGTSYGTFLAQEVIRRHPERIRSAVIDGIVTLDELQWTTMGQAFFDAVQALTSDIAASPDANRLYPGFGDALMDFAATLEPDGEDGYDYGGFFYYGVFHQMNLSRWGYPENIPAIVWRAARGEAAALAELHSSIRLLVDNPSADGPMSVNMYAMILRHDMLPFESMDDADALTNSIPYPLNRVGHTFSQDQFDGSEDWSFVTPADAGFRTAVTNDVPVLVLNGNYDTQTSLAHARHVATNLPNAYYVELPYVGHVVLFGGDVPAQIARDFLADPTVFPDTNGIPGISLDFAPPWTTNDMVLPANGTPQAGEWQSNDFGAVGVWRRFAAEQDQHYVFEIDSSETAFALNVVDTNANVLATSSQSATPWICPEAGDYHAWLNADNQGTFTLALASVTNVLTEGSPAAGELALGQTIWYRVDLPVGTYSLACENGDVTLRVVLPFDGPPLTGPGPLLFSQTTPGTLYVALDTLQPQAEYQLVAQRAPLLMDQAQATPAGMVLTWISQPGTNYAVAIATNLMDEPAFVALPGDIPSTTGISTTWTAAPSASTSAFYRVQSAP